MSLPITVYSVFFHTLEISTPPQQSFQFFRKLPQAQRQHLIKAWRRTFLASYFIGIMRSFQNRVKIYGAIRQDEHMENLEDEVHKETAELKQPYILYPDEPFKTYWNILLIFLLLLTAVLTPFKVCFVK